MACDYWAFGAGATPPGSGYAPCGRCERCSPEAHGAVVCHRLVHQLDKAGLLPPGCKLIDIVIGVSGAVLIKYERMLSANEIEQLGIALTTAVSDHPRRNG